MESQLGNYTLSADNTGIHSLLTAIEQSEDNFDPVNSPSKMIDKDSLSVAENFSNLQNHFDTLEMSGEINLSTFTLCVICGKNPDIDHPNEGMVDVLTEVAVEGEKGVTLSSVIEEFLPIRIDGSRSGGAQCCVECFIMVDGIAKLRAQIEKYINNLRVKYDDWSKRKAKFPTISDYNSMLKFEVPLNFLKDDDLSGSSTKDVGGANPVDGETKKKSKLEILAETLEQNNSPEGMEDIVESDEIEEHLTLNKENEIDEMSAVDSFCDTCGRPTRSNGIPGEAYCSVLCARGGARTKVSSREGGQKSFECTHCDKKFKSKCSLTEHTKLKHLNQIKSYQCSECTETFTSKHSKSVHERFAHKGNRSLSCDECGDSFQTFQSLQYHKSKHTGVFSFFCQYCAKGFNNFKLLEEHSNIHTSDKPYTCNVCSKSFANRGSLWLHVKKHETKKPYVCDYCNKGFGHSSHLVVHKRMHTGEKPYICRFCEEGFISGNHLKRHMRSHQNELPFACGLCKQEFGKRSELVKHGNSVHNGCVVDDHPSRAPQASQVAAGSSTADNAVAESPKDGTADVSEATVRVPATVETVSGEEVTVLVDPQERILLNKLGTSADYVLPVSLLEDMEDGTGKEIGEQTIVFIQVPSTH